MNNLIYNYSRIKWLDKSNKVMTEQKKLTLIVNKSIEKQVK